MYEADDTSVPVKYEASNALSASGFGKFIPLLCNLWYTTVVLIYVQQRWSKAVLTLQTLIPWNVSLIMHFLHEIY